MKRLLVRMSILSIFVALGLIAIAQARHGLSAAADETPDGAASPDVPLPEGAPPPIRVDQKSQPLRSMATEKNPLRSSVSAAEGDEAGLPSRFSQVPPRSAPSRDGGGIPPAAAALARHDGNEPRPLADRVPSANTSAAADIAPAGNSLRETAATADRYGEPRQMRSVIARPAESATPAENRSESQPPAQARFVEDDPPIRAAASPEQSIRPQYDDRAAAVEPPIENRPARLRESESYDEPQPLPDANPLRTDEPQPLPGREPVESRARFTAPTHEPPRESNSIKSTSPEGAGLPGARQLEGTQSPSLTLQKIAPQEIQVGKECTFEIIISNVGAVTATNVEVWDEIPQGTKLIGANPRSRQGVQGELIWDVGTLEPGSSTKVSIELMPVAEGEIGSVATVRFAAQASVRTTATKPELALRLSAPPKAMIGDQVKFKIEIANPGSGAATGVVLLENIPEGLKHSAGRSLEFEVGTLGAGESRQLELVLTAEQAGMIENVIVAHADANLEVEQSIELEVVAPQLSVAVDGPTRRYLERPATYVVSVDNPGTASAKEIELVSYLPKGMKFVKANNSGQYDAKTHSVIWGLAELPAKASGSVEVVTIPIEAGDQQIRVEGKAQQGLADRTEQMIQVEGLAAVLFTVADVNDPIEVGGETIYEIRVVNQGSKAAEDVEIVALLPQGIKAISAEGPTRHSIEPGRVVFAPLARLAPKADTTYNIKLQAVSPGDQRVRVQLSTDEIRTPVTKEESTRVYADQ